MAAQASKTLTDADIEKMERDSVQPSKGVGLTDAQLDQMESSPNFGNEYQSTADPRIMDDILGVLKDVGIGAVGQGFNIASSPYRLITGDQSVAYKPKGLAQKSGANALELGSYFLPVLPEAKILSRVQAAMRNTAAPLRIGADLATRAGMGVAGTEASAFANAEPAPSPYLGATVPLILSDNPLTRKITGPIANFMRRRAITSMNRALEPSGQIGKAQASEVSPILLDRGDIWATQHGLENKAQQGVNMTAKAKAEARAEAGENPFLDQESVDQMLIDAAEKDFMKGEAGGMLQGGKLVGQTVKAPNVGEEMNLFNDFMEWLNKNLRPQAILNADTGKKVYLFDRLDVMKGSTGKQAANKGAFLDIPGLNLNPKSEMYETVTNALRPELEKAMPQKWAEANKQMHEFLLIRKLAQQRQGKDVGRPIPLSERPVSGFGSHIGLAKGPMNDPTLPIRVARLITNRPLWNSMVAQAKDSIYKILMSKGLAPTQAVALADAYIQDFSKPSQEEAPKPGTKVILPTQGNQMGDWFEQNKPWVR